MSNRIKWTADQMPDLRGKNVVVTGANSGLGFEISLAMSRKGATVIMACRDQVKGQRALEEITKAVPQAKLDLIELDLADLTSIRDFAEDFSKRYDSLHILCNNAGVMAIPYRETAQGFEMQFGTNHLGHFALTGLLMPTILKTEQARVVTTSSMLHRPGKINFADLHGKTGYNPSKAYSQSKLANLLFAYELQRKFEASKASAISVASHPGYSATNLQMTGPQLEGSAMKMQVMKVSNRLFAQSSAMGALPTLYAATAQEVRGGDYVGPVGLMEMRGYPGVVRSNELSYDKELAQRLWTVSEELTGVTYSSLEYQAKN
ncbi:MAG TPA: oxidoreductase [Chloroflexia bacterium]|nr:oxidoreductase [Chloroflexia bacterium]